jgi:hypothetical protein
MLTLCDAADTRAVFDYSEAEMLHNIRMKELLLKEGQVKLHLEQNEFLREINRHNMEALKAKREAMAGSARDSVTPGKRQRKSQQEEQQKGDIDVSRARGGAGDQAALKSIEQLVNSVIGTRVTQEWDDGTYEGYVVDAHFQVLYDDGDLQWEKKASETFDTKCCRSDMCTKNNRHRGRCNNLGTT